jgi:anti-sigma factor RsiW
MVGGTEHVRVTDMNEHAKETQLQSYLDGELDPVHSLEIESHLKQCRACSQDYRNLQTLRSTIRSQLPYYSAPAGLRRRVEVMLQEAAKTERPRARLVTSRPWVGIGVGASVAFAIMMAWNLGTTLWRTPVDTVIAGETISGHVRSLMAKHLTDVVSSDLHTVKPWFNGKLDFSPTVKDFNSEGFPLVGGRLDYIDNRPVAALVFSRRQHLINLFTWPADRKEDEKVQRWSQQGYLVIHWTQSGMEYWAVSDMNEKELQEFVRLYRE